MRASPCSMRVSQYLVAFQNQAAANQQAPLYSLPCPVPVLLHFHEAHWQLGDSDWSTTFWQTAALVFFWNRGGGGKGNCNDCNDDFLRLLRLLWNLFRFFFPQQKHVLAAYPFSVFVYPWVKGVPRLEGLRYGRTQ
jgi:hypothetical protein